MNRTLRVTASVAAVAAAGLLLALGIPKVTGVHWRPIAGELAGLSATQVGVLAVVWLAGLAAYTVVLDAALPGLGNVRAFVLNTTGSAVSNAVPFGGALGVGVAVAYTRRWGFPKAAIAVFTLLTGAANVVGRLALAALGLLALAVSGSLSAGLLAATSLACAALFAAVTAAVVVLRSARASRWVATGLDRLARLLPAGHRPGPGGIDAAFEHLRELTRSLAGATWLRLTAGMAAYFGLQAVLFAGCLAVTGGTLALPATFAAFAVGRVLTQVLVTPGGTGITETGTTALLVALGSPPAAAAAGVLLFSCFTFALEIPLGCAVAAATAVLDRSRPRR